MKRKNKTTVPLGLISFDLLVYIKYVFITKQKKDPVILSLTYLSDLFKENARLILDVKKQKDLHKIKGRQPQFLIVNAFKENQVLI